MTRVTRYLVLVLSGMLLPAFGKEARIEIIYPRPGQTVQATRETFMIGNITPPDAALKVAGQPVTVYRTGGFLTMVPVKAGPVEILCELTTADGKMITHTLSFNTPLPALALAAPPNEIESHFLLPDSSMGILPGEPVWLQCRTRPDRRVLMDIGDITEAAQLHAQSPEDAVKGIYRGVFVPRTLMENAAITLRTDKPEVPPLTIPARLTVRELYNYPVVEVLEDEARARYVPGGGYDTFLRAGTRLQSTGFIGDWHRLLLSENRTVFLERTQVLALVPGVLPSRTQVGNIQIDEDGQALIIQCFNTQPVNTSWEDQLEDPHRIRLRLYRSTANTDRVTRTQAVQSLDRFFWKQTMQDEVDLFFQTRFQPIHGASLSFEAGRLIVRIKKPLKERAPKDILICLDAGHGPDSGAVGPTGVTEEAVNLALARTVKGLLEQKGYRVFLTRDKREGPELYSRASLASAQGADLFLSLHYNATGDGVNPYDERGTETYYYNEAGRHLAEALHPRITAAAGIKDKGIRFGNFAVLRNFQIPSVLLEIDYLIVPEAEERTQDPDFQKRIAEALLDGLEWYLQGNTAAA